MHTVETVLVSPEGNLIVAIFPSLAISCAKAPALRAITAPAPGFSSIQEITVPSGIFDNGRLLCLYTYESDLSDGWEDSEVHNDPEAVREKALKMGANIVKYAFEKSL